MQDNRGKYNLYNEIIFGFNIVLFIVMVIVNTIIAYSYGFGANNDYDRLAWIFLGATIAIHLLANGLLLKRFKMYDKWRVILSNLFILLLYGFLIWRIGYV
jgi:hypothetical protein